MQREISRYCQVGLAAVETGVVPGNVGNRKGTPVLVFPDGEGAPPVVEVHHAAIMEPEDVGRGLRGVFHGAVEAQGDPRVHVDFGGSLDDRAGFWKGRVGGG